MVMNLNWLSFQAEKIALLSLFAVSLSGCTHVDFFKRSEDLQQSLLQHGKPSVILDNIGQLHCQPLMSDDESVTQQVVINELTPQLTLPTGSTPFIAYQLPENAVFKVTIDSYPFKVKDRNQVFYPAIALLDGEKNIIKAIPEKQIKYRPPSFSAPERIESEMTINNIQNKKKADCLLIYTTDKNRESTTRLFNEAKEYAKVRGVVPPPVPDPIASHGNLGHLSIQLKPVAQYGHPLPQVQHVTVIPTSVAGLPAPVTDPYMVKTERYYLDKIKAELTTGNISDALDTRREYKNLVRSIEGYFISHYGKTPDSLSRPQPPAGDSSFTSQTQYYFQNKISSYLEAGEGSKALTIIDHLKQLQGKIDNLFNQKR